ncbi:PAS domain-containing sensor histidine kinase [Fibrisoma montanum]|nr:ATP-binding protein [Fibrisoma montanum]
MSAAVSLFPEPDPGDRKLVYLLQGMLDASPGFVCYCEPIWEETGPEPVPLIDLVYRLVNRPLCQLLGHSVDEVVNQRMTHFLPSVKATGLLNHYGQILLARQAQQFDFTYNADGFSGGYRIEATPLLDGLVISFTELPPPPKPAIQPADQSAMLQSIIDNSLSGLMGFVAIRDEQDRITDFRVSFFNPVCLALTGLTADYFRQRTFRQQVPPDHLPAIMAVLQQVVTQRQSTRVEFFSSHINRWVDIGLSPLGDGFLASFIDITDRKRATSRLQSIIDQAHTAIATLKPVRTNGPASDIVDFEITLANRTLADYVRTPPAPIVQRLMSESFPSYKVLGLFDRYRQTAEEKVRQRFEFHYNADGIDAWVDVQIVPLDGEVLITLSNHTLLKQTQLQLENKLSELNLLNENLEQFTYTASHDLQEPLRKVRTFGDMILDAHGPALGEGGTDLVRRMQGAVTRMQELIRGLLMYSRTATDRQPHQVVDLNTIIDDVLDDLEPVLTETKANLAIDPLPVIQGDPLQLRQLFQNLLSNALKFSRADVLPDIHIDVCETQPTDLPAGIQAPAGGFVVIAIRDNGIGFDPEHEERIFELFQRLNNRSQHTGTGIGLAICKRVVENHGGTITVKSRPGAGSTFTVYLPRG